MRRLIAAVLAGLILTGSVACSDSREGGAGGDAGFDDLIDDMAGDAESPPPCPFTAEQVSEFVGQPVAEEDTCFYRGEDSSGIVYIIPATEFAATATYDRQREVAGESYDVVTDIDKGDRGYIAYQDTGGEAAVVSSAGSYTIELSGFESLSGQQYEAVLLRMLDALGL